MIGDNDALARMVSAIVSDENADLASSVAAGAKLGAMLAGVHQGLLQGGAAPQVALEVTKTVAVAGFQHRK